MVKAGLPFIPNREIDTVWCRAVYSKGAWVVRVAGPSSDLSLAGDVSHEKRWVEHVTVVPDVRYGLAWGNTLVPYTVHEWYVELDHRNPDDMECLLLCQKCYGLRVIHS